jgi:hypothetical protein
MSIFGHRHHQLLQVTSLYHALPQDRSYRLRRNSGWCVPRHLSILLLLVVRVRCCYLPESIPSGANLKQIISSPQIVTASSLIETLSTNLEKCPSDTYVIVSQPRANAADFAVARSAPHLRKRISGDNENVRSSLSVTDVLGVVDTDLIQSSLEEKCQAGLMTVDASSRSYTDVTKTRGRIPETS